MISLIIVPRSEFCRSQNYRPCRMVLNFCTIQVLVRLHIFELVAVSCYLSRRTCFVLVFFLLHKQRMFSIAMISTHVGYHGSRYGERSSQYGPEFWDPGLSISILTIFVNLLKFHRFAFSFQKKINTNTSVPRLNNWNDSTRNRLNFYLHCQNCFQHQLKIVVSEFMFRRPDVTVQNFMVCFSELFNFWLLLLIDSLPTGRPVVHC